MVCNIVSREGQRVGTSDWNFIGRKKDSPALLRSSPGLGGRRARGPPHALTPCLPWSPRAPQRCLRLARPRLDRRRQADVAVAFCTGRPSGFCLMKEPRRRASPSPILPRDSGPGDTAVTDEPCMTRACKHRDGHSVRQAWGGHREDGPPSVLTCPQNPTEKEASRVRSPRDGPQASGREAVCRAELTAAVCAGPRRAELQGGGSLLRCRGKTTVANAVAVTLGWTLGSQGARAEHGCVVTAGLRVVWPGTGPSGFRL